MKLSDGREVKIDMSQITVREYRSLFDKDVPESESDDLIGKAAGMKPGEVTELPFPDWRRVMAAFWEEAKKPLDEDEEKN